MKKIYLIFLLLNIYSTFAQSKKEQIEILNKTIDSLIIVTNNERVINNSKLKDLKTSFENLQKESSLLQTELKKVNELNLQKDKDNNQLKISINNQLNDSKNLKNELKIISDSLLTIAEELIKIKASNNNVFIPENNYSNLSQQFKNKDRNIEEQKKWVSKILTNQEILTEKCEEYVNDVKNYNLGYDGSIEEEELKIKWGNKYDLNYKNFVHLFETGDCGWGSQKLVKVEYLGELNNGDWFKLTIKGSCSPNNYSQTIDRVIKVVKENNLFLIDYFISLSDDFKDY